MRASQRTVAAFLCGFAAASLVASFFSGALVWNKNNNNNHARRETTTRQQQRHEHHHHHHRAAADDGDDDKFTDAGLRRRLADPSGRWSRVECFLGGERVGHDVAERCANRPPFWRWWHAYRNCYVSNACLEDGVMTLHGLPNVSSPLACVDWVFHEQYQFTISQHAAPANATWHDLALHASRIMPGHFGHDLLNTLFYAFETLAFLDWRFATELWKKKKKGRRPEDSTPENPSFFFVEEARATTTTLLDSYFRNFWYGPGSPVRSERHCFKVAALSLSHAHDAHLVFRRSSPSRTKRKLWRAYRDFLLAEEPTTTRPQHLEETKKRPPRVTLFRRSSLENSSSSSNKLTANGSGRHISNAAQLVERLRRLGCCEVTEADPGRMSLTAQQQLMRRTDVLVSRVGSQVFNAIYLPPGSLCLEIEAPDPAHLYYDHPSTFEELAEIFGHVFRRSTVDDESSVLGEVADDDCCRECRGDFDAFPRDAPTADACCRRCRELHDRERPRATEYRRPKWFMNWWFADAPADLDHVADLVQQYLRDRRFSGAPRPPRCAYEASSWERRWSGLVAEAAKDETVDWTAGCRAMAADAEKARQWLSWIARKTDEEDPPPGIFSRFVCDDEESPQQWIEPLVGHLRHPLFHCGADARRDTLDLMFSTDYLVLATPPPTKKQSLLFDAGASVAYDNCFWGCTKWFVDAYAARGVAFDRILLWEARTDLDHAQYWRTVPPRLAPRMQLFNTPLVADPGAPDNLWTAVAALAAPEDFVVVKLDVDDNDLEVALVRQLLASTSLLGLVDEFFWEHHVRGSPLKRTRVSLGSTDNIGWGDQVPSRNDAPDATLVDSFRLFAELRRRGVRAHSWI